jgi:hypothetical protein
MGLRWKTGVEKKTCDLNHLLVAFINVFLTQACAARSVNKSENDDRASATT